jgi:hypothetical protein
MRLLPLVLAAAVAAVCNLQRSVLDVGCCSWLSPLWRVMPRLGYCLHCFHQVVGPWLGVRFVLFSSCFRRLLIVLEVIFIWHATTPLLCSIVCCYFQVSQSHAALARAVGFSTFAAVSQLSTCRRLSQPSPCVFSTLPIIRMHKHGMASFF